MLVLLELQRPEPELQSPPPQPSPWLRQREGDKPCLAYSTGNRQRVNATNNNAPLQEGGVVTIQTLNLSEINDQS